MVETSFEILPRVDFFELVVVHREGFHHYGRLLLLVHGPRAVAVAHPGALEFRAAAVSSLARVGVRVVLNSFVLALAAKNPRPFCHDVEEALARAPVFLALPARERRSEEKRCQNRHRSHHHQGTPSPLPPFIPFHLLPFSS